MQMVKFMLSGLLDWWVCRRLEDQEELLEEGRLAGLDGTMLQVAPSPGLTRQGLFEEAQQDGDVSQLRRWVVATQGVAGPRTRCCSMELGDQLMQGPRGTGLQGEQGDDAQDEEEAGGGGGGGEAAHRQIGGGGGAGTV